MRELFTKKQEDHLEIMCESIFEEMAKECKKIWKFFLYTHAFLAILLTLIIVITIWK